jgi:outer membrane biosynthesis protein TonB
MGRLSTPLLALALGAVAALALASCGSGDNAKLLPGDTASEITSNLDLVRELAGEGECIGAEDAAQEVSAQIDALGGVDKQLKQTLKEGATRLNEVVESCQEEPEEETEAVETAEEPETVEKKQKAEKPEKPAKTKPEKPEKEEPAETPETTPEPPAGEGEEKGKSEEVPPVEPGGDTGSPSGGVGPGAPAGSE